MIHKMFTNLSFSWAGGAYKLHVHLGTSTCASSIYDTEKSAFDKHLRLSCINVISHFSGCVPYIQHRNLINMY